MWGASEVKSMYIEPTQTKWLSQQVHRTYRCGKCACCANTSDTKMFNHPYFRKKYKIKKNYELSFHPCIYLIWLISRCGLRFVGQRILKSAGNYKRCSLLYRTRSRATCLVGHILVCVWGEGGLVKLIYRREAYWIHWQSTIKPRSMNDTQDLSCFL